jgi:bacterioferritin-associated ferredoxin
MQQHNQPRYEIAQMGEKPTFAGLAKNRIMVKHGMTEQEWAAYDAALSIGLLTLRTAFPTQTRNYSDREHDMLAALWLEIFIDVEPGIVQEAIIRFISADRKGFFPSPGQVMQYVEDIQAERERQETEERIRRHAMYLCELQQRIDNGENCSTCRFCECREVVHKSSRQQQEMRLYCQNPDSYKYEGIYGYGTAACILCDYYEPKQNN